MLSATSTEIWLMYRERDVFPLHKLNPAQKKDLAKQTFFE